MKNNFKSMFTNLYNLRVLCLGRYRDEDGVSNEEVFEDILTSLVQGVRLDKPLPSPRPRVLVQQLSDVAGASAMAEPETGASAEPETGASALSETQTKTPRSETTSTPKSSSKTKPEKITKSKTKYKKRKSELEQLLVAWCGSTCDGKRRRS